jgi:hypothetical protein
MIRENATPFVVPANAGTHNHRPLLLQKASTTAPKEKPQGMGPCVRRDDTVIAVRGSDLPDRLWGICLSSPPSKNFSLRRLLETALLIPPSRPTEGRIAIVTDAGRDAVDASGASDEGAGLRTAKSCGPDASTLAFKSAQETAPATVTIKPDHRGEREGNR